MKRVVFTFFLIAFLPFSIYSMRYWNMNEIAKINCPDVVFGYAIANGDVNGDGFSDLIAGSYTSVSLDKVHVWLGGAPFDTIIDITFTGKHPFGSAVASGDVNNDGYDDVLIGTFGSTATSPRGVRLYYGGTLMDTIPDWTVHQHTTYGCLGHSVALSDLNRDGYPDIILGDPNAGEPPNSWGAVYIYWGAENPDTICDITITGIDDSNFGSSLSSTYDVNGDGTFDLAVGAPDFFSPPSFPKISIFYGSGMTPFDTIPDVKIYNPCNELEYGYTISLLKDINGDGYDDLAAGAHYHNKVYIYYGGNPMDSIYDVVLSGDTVEFGMAVTGIDDANGDNFGDILVGNPSYSLGKGRVYLYCGSNPFDSIPDALAMGESNNNIGWSVAYAGDLNNDGKNEMVFSNYVNSSPNIWIVDYLAAGVQEEKEDRHKKEDIRLVCYPNPFTTSTTISLTFPKISKTKLDIYDVTGKLVKSFSLTTDNYALDTAISWDGKDEIGKKVSTGIYFIKANVGKTKVTKKVMYIK